MTNVLLPLDLSVLAIPFLFSNVSDDGSNHRLSDDPGLTFYLCISV